jgi:hypothetical protein
MVRFPVDAFNIKLCPPLIAALYKPIDPFPPPEEMSTLSATIDEFVFFAISYTTIGLDLERRRNLVFL